MTRWQRLREMLGGNAQTAFNRLTAAPIKAEVGEDVWRAGYPGHAPELLEALTDRAVAEFSAAGALPLQPNDSHADAWVLERLETLRADHSRARERRTMARLVTEESRARLQGLAKPMWFISRVFLCAFAALGTAVAAIAIGALLAPSVDAYLLRSYLASVILEGAETFSALAALRLAIACSSAVLGSQLLAVVLTRGRLHLGFKVAFVFVDLLFAGGFAVVRLGDEFTAQAAAVSVFEFAISGACTALLLALAQVLRNDVERAEPFAIAERELALAEKTERQAAESLEAVDAQLDSHVSEIGAREDAVRRENRLRALAQSTVAAEYMVAVSDLIGEQARNDSAEACMAMIDRHLEPGS